MSENKANFLPSSPRCKSMCLGLLAPTSRLFFRHVDLLDVCCKQPICGWANPIKVLIFGRHPSAIAPSPFTCHVLIELRAPFPACARRWRLPRLRWSRRPSAAQFSVFLLFLFEVISQLVLLVWDILIFAKVCLLVETQRVSALLRYGDAMFRKTRRNNKTHIEGPLSNSYGSELLLLFPEDASSPRLFVQFW